MWPSCGASGCMNNAKVQNIRKQKQTKARRLAPFLSRDRNHFFDQYIVLQRGIAKKNANVDLLGHSSILVWRISMGRCVWQAIVHGAAKSQTRLND